MLGLIGIGLILIALGCYVLKLKGVTFSSTEAAVIEKLYAEEEKLKKDFLVGKEEIIAEYEKIKARVDTLLSLKAKLPIVKLGPVVSTPIAVPPPSPPLISPPITEPTITPPSPPPAQQS